MEMEFYFCAFLHLWIPISLQGGSMSILSNSCNLPLLIVTIVADLIAVIAFVFKSGSWSTKEKFTAIILFLVISAMLYYVSFLPAITSAQRHLQAPFAAWRRGRRTPDTAG